MQDRCEVDIRLEFHLRSTLKMATMKARVEVRRYLQCTTRTVHRAQDTLIRILQILVKRTTASIHRHSNTLYVVLSMSVGSIHTSVELQDPRFLLNFCISGVVSVESTEALYYDNPDIQNSRQQKSGFAASD